MSTCGLLNRESASSISAMRRCNASLRCSWLGVSSTNGNAWRRGAHMRLRVVGTHTPVSQPAQTLGCVPAPRASPRARRHPSASCQRAGSVPAWLPVCLHVQIRGRVVVHHHHLLLCVVHCQLHLALQEIAWHLAILGFCSPVWLLGALVVGRCITSSPSKPHVGAVAARAPRAAGIGNVFGDIVLGAGRAARQVVSSSSSSAV